jgi:ferredoxin
MSRNPFNLDLAMAEIMGFTGRVPLLKMAAERGFCPSSPDGLTVEGVPPKEVGCGDFRLPDAKKGRRFDLTPPFLQPKPAIDRNLCRGCQLCVKSCPQKTIVMVKGKAKIKDKNCIKCYCCQELCTFKAVRIKKSIIYKIVE